MVTYIVITARTALPKPLLQLSWTLIEAVSPYKEACAALDGSIEVYKVSGPRLSRVIRQFEDVQARSLKCPLLVGAPIADYLMDLGDVPHACDACERGQV